MNRVSEGLWTAAAAVGSLTAGVMPAEAAPHNQPDNQLTYSQQIPDLANRLADLAGVKTEPSTNNLDRYYTVSEELRTPKLSTDINVQTGQSGGLGGGVLISIRQGKFDLSIDAGTGNTWNADCSVINQNKLPTLYLESNEKSVQLDKEASAHRDRVKAGVVLDLAYRSMSRAVNTFESKDSFSVLVGDLCAPFERLVGKETSAAKATTPNSVPAAPKAPDTTEAVKNHYWFTKQEAAYSQKVSRLTNTMLRFINVTPPAAPSGPGNAFIDYRASEQLSSHGHHTYFGVEFTLGNSQTIIDQISVANPNNWIYLDTSYGNLNSGCSMTTENGSKSYLFSENNQKYTAIGWENENNAVVLHKDPQRAAKILDSTYQLMHQVVNREVDHPDSFTQFDNFCTPVEAASKV